MTIIDHHQRISALDLTQSFIVQAPAGSGKTELLTQRYLTLLGQACDKPEAIIALTFTKKAAEEMRERVMRALHRAAFETAPEETHAAKTWQLACEVLQRDEHYQWHLLDNPQRLMILTLDAFCLAILYRLPITSQLYAIPNICDYPDEFYQMAARRFIDEDLLSQENQHAANLLLQLDNHLDRLENLLIELLKTRDQWLEVIMACRSIEKDALRNYFSNNLALVIKERMQSLDHHLADSEKKLWASLLEIEFPQVDEHFFDRWQALLQLVLTEKNTWRKRSPIKEKKNVWQDLMEILQQKDLEQACAALRLCPRPEYQDNDWQVLLALIELLPKLIANLIQIFQEYQIIDFIEINQRALQALGSSEAPTDLALIFDHKIQHILIDEFQDTSVTQFKLLEKLTEGWSRGDGKTLFLVGDPMQSIYGFRAAEVGLFLKARRDGVNQVSLNFLQLQTNFRSQEKIIAWNNQMFRHAFPQTEDMGLGAITFAASDAVKIPLIEHDVYQSKVDSDKQEALWMIERIKYLRQFHAEDSIAILIRSRTHLDLILSTLQQEKIPFVAMNQINLSETPLIQDLWALTRALLNEHDRVAWLALLRAPYCGLLLNELLEIAADLEMSIWTKIQHSHHPRVQQVVSVLQHYFPLRDQLPLAIWIEQIWQALGGVKCLSSIHLLKDAQHFFDLVAAETEGGVIRNLSILYQRITQLYASQESTDLNPVQIFTMHQSKGLEFDHVFLPGLDKVVSGNQKPLFTWFSRLNQQGESDLLIAPIANDIYDFIWREKNLKFNHEMTRLLYVAATRAKKSLHLFFKKDEPKAKSLLHPLWPNVLETAEFIGSKGLMLNKEVEAKNFFIRVPDEYFGGSTGLGATPRPVDDEEKYAPLQPVDPQQLGTLMHRFLQLNASLNINPKQLEKFLMNQGCLQFFDSIIYAIENMQQDPRAQWILKNYPSAQNEVSIFYDEKIFIIDRTFIDEQNNRWIIDYKMTESRDLMQQKKIYFGKMQQYAKILTSLEQRPIYLGLYFPLTLGWVEWQYEETQTSHHQPTLISA